MKDLAHFQQQVADINGYETVIQLCEVAPAHHIKLLLSKAAELYAEHCFLQGKQEGEAKIAELSASLYKQGKRNGWNEALHWAAEHAIPTKVLFAYETWMGNKIDKQSILNGLKEE